MPNFSFFTQAINTMLFIALITISPPGHSQHENSLESLILEQDQQLFDVGFNRCDFEVWDRIFGKVFEFYDDRSGLNTDRQSEIRSFRERCSNAPGLKRHLLSSRVSALGADHALQMGEHEFALDGDTIERAKFVHVWRLIDSEWIVSRIISYDHEPVSAPTPSR